MPTPTPKIAQVIEENCKEFSERFTGLAWHTNPQDRDARDFFRSVLYKAFDAGYAIASIKAEESLTNAYLKGLSDGKDKMFNYSAKDIKSGEIRVQSLEQVKRDFFLCEKCSNRICICAELQGLDKII